MRTLLQTSVEMEVRLAREVGEKDIQNLRRLLAALNEASSKTWTSGCGETGKINGVAIRYREAFEEEFAVTILSQ